MNNNFFYVFGYGSLIWRPGFDFVASYPAFLKDHKRDFCILTKRHRGNEEMEGLVMGLHQEKGSTCHGVAFKIKIENKKDVLDYLEDRENGDETIYQCQNGLIWLKDSKEYVDSLFFVANEGSEALKKNLDINEKALIIKNAKGHSGSNKEYFLNVFPHFEEKENKKSFFHLIKEIIEQ